MLTVIVIATQLKMIFFNQYYSDQSWDDNECIDSGDLCN